LSFLSEGWTVYLSVGIEMVISLVMTVLLGYVYSALFLAFYIGNIQHKIGFITLYVVHLVTTIAAVTIGFFTQNEIFLSQLPFIVFSVIGVILLPLTIYFRNKREALENQLEAANQRLSQLDVLEERQRIARDLHDTLAQNLSMIGLKSELAGKLVDVKPDTAKNEINDIHQTARTALNEVREMVSNMKGAKLEDEITRVREMLKTARIDFHMEGNPELPNTPLFVENVLSMCLKEAVTNVVKHSVASSCTAIIAPSADEVSIEVQDDGIGMMNKKNTYAENGLQGIRERLEFINGSMDIKSSGNGTTLTIRVPKVIQRTEQERLL